MNFCVFELKSHLLDIADKNMSIYQNFIWLIMISILNFFSKSDSINIESYSSYKRMDLYHKKALYHEQFCSNFVCKESGLSEIRIKQLIAKENEARNEYANEKNISNMYAVEWSTKFAEFARQKVQLCLYPTSKDTIIFDTSALEEWLDDSSYTESMALEVVIAEKVKRIRESNTLNIFDRTEDEIPDYLSRDEFNYPTALNRRGSTRYMGCDYLVRYNETHIMGHFVCVYGLLYFSDGITNDFTPKDGEACSVCDFFDTRPFLTTNHTTERWACSPAFPFLCDDLSSETTISFGQFLYPCDDQPAIIPFSSESFILVTPSDNNSIVTVSPIKDADKWPCYKYAVPLTIMILCAVLVAVYQTYVIVIHKITRVSGLSENKLEKSYVTFLL